MEIIKNVNEPTQNLPEIENLSLLVGEFMEYWGFKKVHGEIWLHLYLSKRPLDAAQIMKRLKISKALVSITLKDLLIYGVIRESNISPQNTRTYAAVENLSEVIKLVLRRREQVMLGQIRSAHQQLSKLDMQALETNEIDRGRVRELGQLIRRGDRGLELIMSLI